jgi:hypothetical protein
MEASSPARYPDEVATRRPAVSAEVRSALITSDTGGGGGGGPAGSAGPEAVVVSLDEEVIFPATRAISVDSARACAARCVATTVSAAAT